MLACEVEDCPGFKGLTEIRHFTANFPNPHLAILTAIEYLLKLQHTLLICRIALEACIVSSPLNENICFYRVNILPARGLVPKVAGNRHWDSLRVIIKFLGSILTEGKEASAGIFQHHRGWLVFMSCHLGWAGLLPPSSSFPSSLADQRGLVSTFISIFGRGRESLLLKIRVCVSALLFLKIQCWPHISDY